MASGWLSLWLATIVVASVTALDAETCDWPSAFWCDDEAIARRCNVYESCAAFNKSASGRRLKLTLLYETLCKDSQRFIVDEFYPKVFKFAADFVDFEFIPYGNARRKRLANGTALIECQHGPRECRLNRLHGCVINATGNDALKWVPFVYCMESAIRSGGVDPESATADCYKQANLNKASVDAAEICKNGPLGDELQNRAADLTEGVWPHKHFSVPWIVINGLSTTNMQIYQNDLLPALCAWHVGPTKPSGCEFAETVRRLKTCGKHDAFKLF